MEYKATNFLSIKVNDIQAQFKGIKEDGNKETFEKLPYFSNIGVDHIQGCTQYECNGLKYAFSHSETHGQGSIIVTDGIKGRVIEFKTEGWNHPGGIQTIGKYLFIPCEKDNQSKIYIYDLERINGGENPRVHYQEFDKHRAACLGITDFEKDGKNHYLLVIGVDEKYYGYISEVKEEITSLDFSSVGSFSLNDAPGKYKKIKCQGFGLVTDDKNEVYMVAPVTHNCGGSNEDWIYLVKLSLSSNKISYKFACDGRHLTNKGGIKGTDGTHFVWGAGIRIKSNPADKYGKLVLLATSRNIIAGTKLDTNFWL